VWTLAPWSACRGCMPAKGACCVSLTLVVSPDPWMEHRWHMSSATAGIDQNPNRANRSCARVHTGMLGERCWLFFPWSPAATLPDSRDLSMRGMTQ
jgi:hypothetical protein